MLKLETVGVKKIPNYKEKKLEKSTTEKISLSISNYSGCSTVMSLLSLISFSLWTTTSTLAVLMDWLEFP